MKVFRGASLGMGILAALAVSVTASAADSGQVTADIAVTEYTGAGVADFVLTPDLPDIAAIVPSELHPAGDSITIPVDGDFRVAFYSDGTAPMVVGGDMTSQGPALTMFVRDMEIELNHLKFGFTHTGEGAVLYGAEFGARYGRPVFSLGNVAVDVVSDDSVILEAPVYLNQMLAEGVGLDDYAGTLIGYIHMEAVELAARDIAVNNEPLATAGDDAVNVGCPGGGPCGTSPDVITLELGSGLSEYGTVSGSGIGAYAIDTTSCNQGDEWAIWISGNNQHPLIAQNLFRIQDGRFEQIGMSWLKHAWCAADFFACAGGGSPNGSCNYMTIGIADVYSASLNATQSDLGPRSEINAATGQYPYPYQIAWNQSGNNIFKRLQVQNDDLASSTGNDGNAIYLMEAYYITSDEAPANFDKQYNNASWRRVVRQSFNGNQYPLSFTGGTTIEETALEGWTEFDPDVTIVEVMVTGEEYNNGAAAPNGRVLVGTNVTDLGGGMWAYDYTVYNYNSHRSIRSFSIPLPDDATSVSASHHMPFYHSGDPAQNAAPWSILQSSSVSWTGESYTGGNDASANAIRWSTSHSFHLECSSPPDRTAATMGLFRPGTPSSVFANVTGPAPDCNGNNVADGIDIANGAIDTNGNGIPDECEAEILFIESAVSATYHSIDISLVGTTETPFSILVEGDAGDKLVSCVSGYLQDDGSLGAKPVTHTLTEWESIGTTATSDQIIPGASYDVSTEGFASDTVSVDMPLWGDVNGNGIVNLEDAQLAVINFNGGTYDALADLDDCPGNGVINLVDAQLIIGVWQTTFSYVGSCGAPCP